LRNRNFRVTGELLWILGLDIGGLEVGVWVQARLLSVCHFAYFFICAILLPVIFLPVQSIKCIIAMAS